MKFNIIYADPPWSFGSKQYQDGGRDFTNIQTDQYQTMQIQKIKALPVKDIKTKDSVCFMWVTDAHLKEGIEVLEAWGFKYKTIAFVWIKKYVGGATCVNFAPWTLKSTEICLLGISGKMGRYKKSNNVRQLVEAVREKHSQKPEEVRKRIEELFGDLPRIELFARRKTPGWFVWGNEVESDIDLGFSSPSGI